MPWKGATGRSPALSESQASQSRRTESQQPRIPPRGDVMETTPKNSSSSAVPPPPANPPGRRPGPAPERRGGLRRLHAGLPGHGHRHRPPHGGGDGRRPPPHDGDRRSCRELQRGPVRPGGHRLRGGYLPPGQAAHCGGGHGTVHRRPVPGAGIFRLPARRRPGPAPGPSCSGRFGELWADLQRIDPEAAQTLHPNDEKRIIRALEVWYDTGKTISQHNRETRDLPPAMRL